MGFLGMGQRAHPKAPQNSRNSFSCFSQLRTFPIAFGSCYSQIFPDFFFPCSNIFISPWETSGVILHCFGILGAWKKQGFILDLGKFWENKQKRWNRNSNPSRICALSWNFLLEKETLGYSQNNLITVQKKSHF